MSDVIELVMIGGPEDGAIWAAVGPLPPQTWMVAGAAPVAPARVHATLNAPIELVPYGEYRLIDDPCWPGHPSVTVTGSFRYAWTGTR